MQIQVTDVRCGWIDFVFSISSNVLLLTCMICLLQFRFWKSKNKLQRTLPRFVPSKLVEFSKVNKWNENIRIECRKPLGRDWLHISYLSMFCFVYGVFAEIQFWKKTRKQTNELQRTLPASPPIPIPSKSIESLKIYEWNVYICKMFVLSKLILYLRSFNVLLYEAFSAFQCKKQIAPAQRSGDTSREAIR